MVRGIQGTGIGACVKHFAANNQETCRRTISADAPERALREIYFPAFEYIVRNGNPWSVMCAYNRINGEYCSQNRWLLTDVLRTDWGFSGIVVSDWGATHDRIAALRAGLNLEMPPTDSDGLVAAAVADGRLDRRQLDTMTQGVIDLTAKAAPAMQANGYRYDAREHRETARKAAAESIVLLKNEDAVLPLPNKSSLAVIGEFARTPRYQGGGSSHMTTNRATSFLEAVTARSIDARFAPGFSLDASTTDQALQQEAVETACAADAALVFLGLPDSAEWEGVDRTGIDLPEPQLRVLDAVCAVNRRVVAVLANGSAVAVTPWRDSVKGLIESWLLGEEAGDALCDVVFGDCDPSGRLAQTLPLDIRDDPSTAGWPGGEGHARYGEGLFVGYRYYDTFDIPVAYPFGYGLSYARFDLTGATVRTVTRDRAAVDVTVTNKSDRHGAETVEVYIRPPHGRALRPSHELKGFRKVFLGPGESQTVAVSLDQHPFAYWSERLDDWYVESGTYVVEVATSSRDIVATLPVSVVGDDIPMELTATSSVQDWLEDPVGGLALREFLDEKAALKAGPPGEEAHRIWLGGLSLDAIGSIPELGGPQTLKSILASYRTARQAHSQDAPTANRSTHSAPPPRRRA